MHESNPASSLGHKNFLASYLSINAEPFQRTDISMKPHRPVFWFHWVFFSKFFLPESSGPVLNKNLWLYVYIAKLNLHSSACKSTGILGPTKYTACCLKIVISVFVIKRFGINRYFW